MKAIWIDCKTASVKEVEVKSLEDMQKHVGGYIEAAHYFNNGDVLFVDEEGLLKVQTKQNDLGFVLQGTHQEFFAGNGLILGPADDEGELTDVQQTKFSIMPLVQFVLIGHQS